MAWKSGQSGNPSGAQREKKFLAALDRAVAQDGGEKLRKAAEALLDSAAEGNAWAIAMLADRLDGKADQTIRMVRNAKELSDADLSDIAAGSGEGTPGPQDRPQEPSSLH